MDQLELPIFDPFRSTADNPDPETDRTHPAQMIIKHCGKARKHVEHAFREDAGPFGCPGTPDMREKHVVEQQTRDALGRLLERERVRKMELLTYDCGRQHTPHHEPHPHPDGGTCPGLTSRPCGNSERHDHHRWWTVDTFHWCNGVFARRVEDVELP